MLRFIKNTSILKKFLISFLIIFTLFVGLNVYSLFQINSIKDLFINLYKHPYTVSNTIRDIDINIISMHSLMKDIALSKDDIEIKRAIFLVQKHEEEVLKSFTILNRRFLGDLNQVQEAKRIFIQWKPIRAKVLLNMEEGNFKEAASISKNEGNKYINSLYEKMKRLTDFANKKGIDYYINVVDNVEEIYFVIISSLIFIMIIGISILFFLTRYITKELSYLQKGVLNFFRYLNKETDSVTLLRSISNDEIGKISQTINSNIKYTQNIIENEKTLQKEIEKNQLQIIGLNKNLEKRVEEEVIKNLTKEKLLAQQSKMASMGEMIENIAHQWKQPLSIISATIMRVKVSQELEKLDDNILNNAMDTIDTSTDHLSQTIDDFRTFFKIDKVKSKFSLLAAFEKTFKLLASQFSANNITVIKNIENIVITERKNELIQVFINILNNARDELVKKQEENKFIIIDVIKNINSVEISIKDNAGGIPTAIIKDVFNSHFTTKENSKGTGIGLYMSKMIIEEHMIGNIQVSNTDYIYKDIACRGALFKIILPLS